MATIPVPAPAAPATDIVTQIEGLLKQVPTTGISLNTDIGAVANMVTELAKLAQTAEGQAILKQAREDTQAVEKWAEDVFGKIGTWLTGLFK